MSITIESSWENTRLKEEIESLREQLKEAERQRDELLTAIEFEQADIKEAA